MIIRTFHRRKLPHLYYNEGTYFITYRLADTIPIAVINKIRLEVEHKYGHEEKDLKEKRLFKKFDAFLDKALNGPKFLNESKIAIKVKEILHFPDGKQYFLICFCIMSNHVHLVFTLLNENKGVSKIMQSIKRISAIDINKVLNEEGTVWQDESYDRLVRDDIELYNIINYVINNPVKAGLVDSWENWKDTYLAPEYQ